MVVTVPTGDSVDRTTADRVLTTAGRWPVALGAIAAVVGFLGSWNPSYWGDEAASVMSATRSWSSFLAQMSTIDGVHGVYYTALRGWIVAFGAAEASTRLLSALAVGAMVAGTVVLVRRFAGLRFALLVGVIAIVLPRTTAMAVEARSTALAAAAAVWLTVLLVELTSRRASRLAWIAYGVAMTLGVWLFLYLGLLLLVHGVFLLAVRRHAVRRWLIGAATAALLGAPIVVIGYRQREQIAFLVRSTYTNPGTVLVNPWFGQVIIAVAAWALILVAVGWWGWMRARRHSIPHGIHDLAALALAWLLLPSVVLLIGSELISPMYNVRYVAFCVPAVAILVAGGIAVFARLTPRPQMVAAALVAALLLPIVPGYLTQRGPFAKDGGSDWRQVSQYLAAHAEAGDAVVFDQTVKPFRSPRLALRLYPSGFVGLDDVQLVTPFDETDGLWDVVANVNDLPSLVDGYGTVWALEVAGDDDEPLDVRQLRELGYRVDSAVLINVTMVYRLTLESPTPRGASR